MAKSTVAIRFVGDVADLKRAIGDVDSAGGKLKSGLVGAGKAIGLGLAGAAVGAVALGKGFVDAAVESQKATKQTEAVLKSMGGQAGVTAKDVADLSEELSMLSGVDDELIQSAQNVLLTFGKVQNKVGEGNDIFDRATKSALDMSVALGGDLQGATVMIGKALNDPIKGITAMTRAGVSFTQQQKDQIKAMVEAGDTLGAQKLIMSELEKQFGGSAKAQATAGERLKVVWGNLQEELGAKLLPVVEKVAQFLADHMPAAIDAVGRAFSALTPFLKQVQAFFKTLFSGFTEDEGTRVEGIALKVRAAFEKVVAWVQANWPKIQEVISQVMTTIGAVIGAAVTIITVLWENFGNNILQLIERIWPRIQQIIEGALAIIRGIVQTVTALIQGDWSGAWEGIKTVVTGAWEAIQGIIGAALELIRSIVGVALEILGSLVKGAFDAIVTFIAGIPGRIASALSTLAAIVTAPHRAAIEAAKTIISTGLDTIVGFFGGLWNRIGSAMSTVADAISAPFRIAFAAIKRLWNSTAGGFGFSIPSWVPGVGGKEFRIPSMHTGGIVPGGPSAEHLRLLQGGEGVFTRDQMAALGGLIRGRAQQAQPVVVNITVNGSVLSERDLFAALDEGVRKGMRVAGIAA